MNKYYVYALIDPINRVPFYIGKGCDRRAWVHLSKYDKCNLQKHSYINKLRSLDVEPEVLIIKNQLNEKEAYDIEYFLIKESVKHFPITNKVGVIKPPSRKGCKLSAESILKRKSSIAERKSNGWVKPPISNEQKQKLRKANLGKTLSIDTREKIKATLERQFLEKYKYLSAEYLYDMYVIKNNTLNELCQLHGIAKHTLKKILSKIQDFKEWKT